MTAQFAGPSHPEPPDDGQPPVNDWIARGRQVSQRWLTDHGSPPEPAGALSSERGAQTTGDGEPDSWRPVDLSPYLDGVARRPVPSMGIVRSDGLRLLYPGKEHAVLGEMESGKSWFCLACAAAELCAGHRVVYIHFEESDPTDTVERLQALGVLDHHILTGFDFVSPERPVTLDALAALVDPTPSIAVLDGVNEAMSLHRWNVRDEDGAALFRRCLVKPFTRVGAATLAADHVVKDPERRGRNALGSVHKVNGLSGALILLENADPFGRGQRGRSHVFLTKDRPGFLRRHGRPTRGIPGKTFIGELVVDDTGAGLDLRLWAPSGDDTPATPEDTPLADTVVGVLEQLDGQAVASERELLAQLRKAGCSVRDSRIRGVVDDLIVDGRLVETSGKRGAKGYKLNPTASQDHDGLPPP